MQSPLAVDAQPFETALECLRWAFVSLQHRGSGAWHGKYVRAEAGVRRPCEPLDVVRVCDMVIKKYELDQGAQGLIVCAALGNLSPEQWQSAQWLMIERRLAFYLADRGFLAKEAALA